MKGTGIISGMDLEKPYPEWRKQTYVCCAVIMAVVSLILFGCSQPALGVLFLLLAVGNVSLGFFEEKEYVKQKNAAIEEEKEQRIKFEAENPFYRQEQFFQYCQQKGITDITEKASFERVKLMAQAFPYLDSEEKIREAFLTGKHVLEAKELNAKREKNLALIKIKEQSLYQKNTEYYGLQGREKPIAYCMKMINQYAAEVKKQKQNMQDVVKWGSAAYSLGKEKESDWALLGGIASGIAGGAAGLATALDVQNKNAGVRERNASFANNIASSQAALWDAYSEQEQKAANELKHWQEKLERAKLLLVDNQPKNQLLKKLKPTVEKVWISESELLHLSVKTSSVKMKIFETVDATIDGDFKAVVYHGDNRLGEISFTLPEKGALSPCVMEGLTMDSPTHFSENTDYAIQFETDNLFAIEVL